MSWNNWIVFCGQRTDVLEKSSCGREDINKSWAAIKSSECNCWLCHFHHVWRKLSPLCCDVNDWKAIFFPSQNFNLYEKGYENYLYEKLMFCFCKQASNTDVSHEKVQLHECIWHGEHLAKVLEACQLYVMQQKIQTPL